MELLGPACLALIIGATITALELLTVAFPMTSFLLVRNSRLYAYALIYGVIAFGAMLGLDSLVSAGTVKFEGLGLSSPWVRAVAVGLTTKGLLNINFFNISVGSNQMPVGLATFVQFFEPQLIRSIYDDEWNARKVYLELRAAKYTDLETVKTKIKDNIPSFLSETERESLALAVSEAGTVYKALDIYLRKLGRSTFERVFPL